MLQSYNNPCAWFLVFLFGSIFPKLRAATNSWHLFFMSPLAVRLGAQIYSQRNTAITTAREHYERSSSERLIFIESGR